MPDYWQLDQESDRDRILEGLERLREQLVSEVPPKTLDATMLLATWNLREFDSPAYGPRVRDAFYFIAEIISRFDLVAVQEVHRDLTALQKLIDVLGPAWKYLISDTTEGAPGNDERLAFLYDSRKVHFTGLAGEIVLPPLVTKIAGKKHVTPAGQVARTPYTVSFRCGWTSFQLATVHILWGEDAEDHPVRVEEIAAVARFFAERADDPVAERASGLGTLVLLGDFNIFAGTSETMIALTKHGWVVPAELQRIPGSNVARNRRYDQIALRPDPHWFEPTGAAGVIDFYQSVMRDGDEPVYALHMGDAYGTTSKGRARDAAGKRRYYKTYWRTYQMSDHLPMWIEIRTDYSAEYLAGKRSAPG